MEATGKEARDAESFVESLKDAVYSAMKDENIVVWEDAICKPLTIERLCKHMFDEFGSWISIERFPKGAHRKPHLVIKILRKSKRDIGKDMRKILDIIEEKRKNQFKDLGRDLSTLPTLFDC